MKHKIITEHFGIIHAVANCNDCDWINEELPAVKCRELCKRHVAQTGHTVMIETGNASKYSASPKDDN